MKTLLHATTLFVLLTLLSCASSPKKESAQPPVAPAPTIQALAQARDAARQDPNNAQAHYKLGNALFDTGQYDEARASYEAALKLEPNHASAHANLGLCLRRLGRVPQAIEQYRAALALDSKDTTTLLNLAVALEVQGDFKGAVKELQKLAELQPGDLQVLSHLANDLFQMKQYQEAAKVFGQILQIDPGRADHYYNLGLCQFCMENWDAALATWLTALAHDAKHPAVNKGVAVAYWKRGDYKQAWAAVAHCQALGIPLDPEFISGLQKDSGQMGPQ